MPLQETPDGSLQDAPAAQAALEAQEARPEAPELDVDSGQWEWAAPVDLGDGKGHSPMTPEMWVALVGSWPRLGHGLGWVMASVGSWPRLGHGLGCVMASVVSWPRLCHGLGCVMAHHGCDWRAACVGALLGV